MSSLTIHGDHITLAQALKVSGIADNGGHAKHLVRSGVVRVNGAAETRPGRKLVPGDRFQVGDETEWTVGPTAPPA